MPGLLTFGASLDLFFEWGLDAVARRIADRAEAVRELAASAGWTVYGSPREADRSAIVVLETRRRRPGRRGRRAAPRHGVVAACRRGRLRISPHVYNNDDDLDRLRAGLESIRLIAVGQCALIGSTHGPGRHAWNPKTDEIPTGRRCSPARSTRSRWAIWT